MTELEYIEKIIEITQSQIDKANKDLLYYTQELNMLLSVKRKIRETEE